MLELGKGRFAGETEIAGARESAAVMLSGERSRGGGCAVCGCSHRVNVARVMVDECTNIVLYLYHCYTENVMEKNLSLDAKIGNNRNECNTCYADLIVLSFFSMLSLFLMEILRLD